MHALSLVSALCALIAAAPALRGQTQGATDEVRLGPGDVVRIEAMLARSGPLTTSLPTPQALAKYLRDTNHGHLVQSWIDPITGAFCGITDGGGVASHPWCQRCIQAKAQPKAQAPEAPNEEKPVSYIL